MKPKPNPKRLAELRDILHWFECHKSSCGRCSLWLIGLNKHPCREGVKILNEIFEL